MDQIQIAVLIPCYNEEISIAKVIDDFQRELPDAAIYVYDNNSHDNSCQISMDHGAVLRREYRQGKGNVVRKMFREVNADVYLLVDGDDTYPAEYCHELIARVVSGQADMVVGDRLSNGSYKSENSRHFHSFGNHLVKNLINALFRSQLNDIMSGYRCFSRAFVKTIPVMSPGFEIETEMTLHALDKRFSIQEVPIPYRDRPEGSVSKLNTLLDGTRVVRTIFMMFKDYRPFAFFSSISLLLLVLGVACGFRPILDYVVYQYVYHVPLAILATGLVILSALSFVCGVIADAIAKLYRHQYEMHLNSYSLENTLDRNQWR